MFQRILLFVTLAAAVLPASARSHAVGRNPRIESRRIKLRELLPLREELVLPGRSNSRAVAFRLEPNSVAVDGNELHLLVRHSPRLDGSRSFLSITLNYGVLRSIRLDDANERLVELVIPLPAASLKPSNELAISIEQFGTPGAPAESVWTAISPESYIALQYELRKPAPDLRSLPESLLGDSKTLDVVIPERASTPTLEAAAVLLATFASRIAPEPLRARAAGSIRGGANPVLIVGTPAEQPDLRTLGVPEAESAAGLVNRGGEEGAPILYVTGAKPADVLRAAKSLVELGAGISGKMAAFPAETRFSEAAPRHWQGFIPPADRFTLADLGSEERKIDAAEAFTVNLALDATPDAVFLDEGHEMTLSFRFDDAAFDLNPELVIELNGKALKRQMLREMSKRPQFSVTVPVPARLLRGNNTLRIYAFGRGEAAAIHTLGALLPDSQFYLPRDYRAVLPDLALLRHSFYPFSVKADFSDTMLLLPDAVGPAMFQALLQLSSGLGRVMPGDRAAFHVRRFREATAGELAASHAIFLGAGVSPGQFVKTWPRMPDAHGGPAVQEVLSPWNSKKCVLSITAASAESLEQAIGRLFESVYSLEGDAAYLTGARPRCFSLVPRQTLVEASFLRHVQARLSANWIALPLVLSFVSGILFIGLRLVLAQRKQG